MYFEVPSTYSYYDYIHSYNFFEEKKEDEQSRIITYLSSRVFKYKKMMKKILNCFLRMNKKKKKGAKK